MFHVIVHANLIIENVIEIKSGIRINVNVNTKI